MKIISNEEFDNLPQRGRGRAGVVYNKIFNLRVDQNLVIEKKDWHRSDTPGRLCRYIEKRHPPVKYKCVSIDGDMGWAVKRLA